jgi:hypothetical protein
MNQSVSSVPQLVRIAIGGSRLLASKHEPTVEKAGPSVKPLRGPNLRECQTLEG